MWLAVELNIEFVHNDDLLSDEVHAENAIDFCKDDSVTIQAFRVFKVEIHGDLLEDRNIFNHYLGLILKVISKSWVVEPTPSINEQLVGLLLIHNQILTTYDS